MTYSGLPLIFESACCLICLRVRAIRIVKLSCLSIKIGISQNFGRKIPFDYLAEDDLLVKVVIFVQKTNSFSIGRYKLSVTDLLWTKFRQQLVFEQERHWNSQLFWKTSAPKQPLGVEV